MGEVWATCRSLARAQKVELDVDGRGERVDGVVNRMLNGTLFRGKLGLEQGEVVVVGGRRQLGLDARLETGLGLGHELGPRVVPRREVGRSDGDGGVGELQNGTRTVGQKTKARERLGAAGLGWNVAAQLTSRTLIWLQGDNWEGRGEQQHSEWTGRQRKIPQACQIKNDGALFLNMLLGSFRPGFLPENTGKKDASEENEMPCDSCHLRTLGGIYAGACAQRTIGRIVS